MKQVKQIAFAVIFCTACISQRVVPPPAVPLTIAPKVAGPGNVVLDVTGQEHAQVYALQKIGTPDEELVELCITPCAFTLQPGKYSLRFTSQKNAHFTSTADVEVPARGKILVRHALGYERRMSSGIGFSGLLLGGIGLVGTLIGASTLATGNQDPSQAATNRAIGSVMLGLGVVLFGTAWALLHYRRGERQEGSTITAQSGDRP